MPTEQRLRSLTAAWTCIVSVALTGADARAIDGGASAGLRYRVLVSTDLGGSDEDDIQSMIHYLVYADVFDTEGLISSPPGKGRARDILKVIDAYAEDFKELQSWSGEYPTPDFLRSVTRQGATAPAPKEGFSQSTPGSQWIVHCAKKEDPRPLYVLVWGSITDVAQALHDDPSIKDKIRVYFIASWNHRQDPHAVTYIDRHHPDLWMIYNDTTFRGWYVGGDQDGDWGNGSFVKEHVAGHGALGDMFGPLKGGEIKMGDTPSVAYLLRGTPDDPTQDSWGGRFVKKEGRPCWWTDDPEPQLAEGGHAGAKTVNRWRRDYLYHWQGYMDRCLRSRREAQRPVTDTGRSPHAKLLSPGLDEVSWGRGFWADRFHLCRQVTLPMLYEQAADPNYGHAVENLKIAAGLAQGSFTGTHWHDAWVYKWLEAAAAMYAATGDADLDARMDELVKIITAAQQPDGYVASQITARGWERFQDPHHHELYTMGHLLTAACIHHRATGKDALLNVAKRCADCLHEQFKDRDPKMAHFPRNPSVVMGAVELYRTTREKRYLDLANNVINMRGAFKGGSDLNQDRKALRHEDEVVGHAVFYTYLYAGAADAYMETGDKTLLEALERLWTDLVQHKMYVTGGCCAMHRGFSIRNGNVWGAHDVHEAVGPPYDLPNSTAYNETCSQVGNFMWNWRMLTITGEARFTDVMEREMYNGFLPGISLDGKTFFYSNPLRWYGDEHVLLSNDTRGRHPIGPTQRICCPTNVLRTLVEMQSYFYSRTGKALWIHHYGSSTFDDGAFKVSVQTDYPWDGRIHIRIHKSPVGGHLRLRIPEWADFPTKSPDTPHSVQWEMPGTYTSVGVSYPSTTLELPMHVRLLEAHHKVEQVRNHVAVMRGPIVYCLESIDLPHGASIWDVALPRDVELKPRHMPDLLGGVTVLEGQALHVPRGRRFDQLYREISSQEPKPIPIRLIPYYAWANRGTSQMTVWLPIR